MRDPSLIAIILIVKACSGSDDPPPTVVAGAGGSAAATSSSSTSATTTVTTGGEGGQGGAGVTSSSSSTSGGGGAAGGQGGAATATTAGSGGGGCLTCEEALAVGVDGPGDDRLCPGSKSAIAGIWDVGCGEPGAPPQGACSPQCADSLCFGSGFPPSSECKFCLKDTSSTLDTCAAH